LWNGAGAVHVRRRDPARRALLLERARPGTDISGLPEGEATAIAVEVAWRLWKWADEPFRWIGDHVPRWLAAPERETELVPLARRVYSSLDVGRSTLVHGDFHHHNILSSARGPLAIDPKPMLGEPEFDVAPFLWNPMGSPLDREVAEGRLHAFAAAGLDQRRMRAWAVVRGGYLGIAGEEAEVLRDLLAG
jgi:streptomycin 6-kinase